MALFPAGSMLADEADAAGARLNEPSLQPRQWAPAAGRHVCWAATAVLWLMADRAANSRFELTQNGANAIRFFCPRISPRTGALSLHTIRSVGSIRHPEHRAEARYAKTPADAADTSQGAAVCKPPKRKKARRLSKSLCCSRGSRLRRATSSAFRPEGSARLVGLLIATM